VNESFPDVGANFDALANPNSKAVVTFRVSLLADALKVASALGVERLAFRLPKTAGAPLFISGDVAEDLLAVGEASGMDEAGIFEALVSQVDPFGDKEEKPSKTPQTKLPFDAGPSEATPADTVADPATPEEPAPTRPHLAREWKPSDDIIGLSIHRPWAPALVLGLKEYETRPYDCNVAGAPWRSWVAIAASKEEPEDAPPSLQRLVREKADAMGLWKELEPSGAIIWDCVPRRVVPDDGRGGAAHRPRGAEPRRLVRRPVRVSLLRRVRPGAAGPRRRAAAVLQARRRRPGGSLPGRHGPREVDAAAPLFPPAGLCRARPGSFCRPPLRCARRALTAARGGCTGRATRPARPGAFYEVRGG
jgi:hypothetical protein